MGYHVKAVLLQTPDIKLPSAPARRQLINDRYGKALGLCIRLFGFSGFCKLVEHNYSKFNFVLSCRAREGVLLPTIEFNQV